MSQVLYKNTDSQKIIIFARNSLTGAAATGIASTITGYISLDGAAAASIGNPTEIGGGLYYFSPSQANTNADLIGLYCTTTTSNVLIDPLAITTGSATPNVNIAQISGDSTAADNAELFYDGTGYDATNSKVGSLSGTVDGINIEVILQVLLASVANKVTGANGGAATIVFYDRAGSTLLTIDTDQYGNRAANGTLAEA